MKGETRVRTLIPTVDRPLQQEVQYSHSSSLDLYLEISGRIAPQIRETTGRITCRWGNFDLEQLGCGQ